LLLAGGVFTAAALFGQSPVPAALMPALHDGARDFDPLLGNFTFQLHYMLHPLTSTPDWSDMTGTGSCYKVWDGRAQLDTVELDSQDDEPYSWYRVYN
jgi:hypothetical protein